MSVIIKGLRARMAPRAQLMDLTRPDSGVTPEEREALGIAAGVIAGKVVNLDAYRERRRCECCGRLLRMGEGKVCGRCEATVALMAMREEGPGWE